MTIDTARSTVRETYEAMIEEATKQAGVFEVMQVMGRVAQYRDTLEALQRQPTLHFTASSSSCPPVQIYRPHA